MNIVKEQLKNMTFSTEKPKNFNIINENVNTILLDEKNFEVLEEKVKTIVIGGTNGIGKEIIELLNEKKLSTVNIGSRSKKTDEENNFIGGDIYDINSEAYKVILELAESKEPLKIILNAGFNMDKTPGQIDGKTYKDTIDPRTGEVWEDITNKNVTITTQEKNQIRKEIADKQINFYKTFFETLSNRKSKEKITIVFSNGTIAKYKESPFLKDSMYGYSKQETTKIITNLFGKLKEKNVHVKDVFLGLVKTDMLKIELLERTVRLLQLQSIYFPLDGKNTNQKKILSPKYVADLLFKIININPIKIPDQVTIINENEFKIEEIQKIYKIRRLELIKLINSKNFKKDNIFFITNDYLKKFLLKLRENSLKKYYKENKENINKKINLYKNINSLEKTLKNIPKKITLEHLLYLCFKAENNYP